MMNYQKTKYKKISKGVTTIISNYKRFENETDEELIFRICKEKDSIGSWKQVGELLNQLTGYEYTESKYRKQFQAFQKMLDANRELFVDDDEHLKEIKLQLRELEKERKKIQTEKLEYNKWLREEARDELITDRIIDAVKSLSPLSIPVEIDVLKPSEDADDIGYVLAFGDEHYGIEFEIPGLYGETLNRYNPEVFEDRMMELLNQTIKIVKEKKIKTLNVFNMGDSLEGIIRASQLMKLRYGVVDSAIYYAEYITSWLNVLSHHTHIKFQAVHGNHSELRMISQPKGTFTEDNMGKVVTTFIKTRLRDNPNFTYIDNPTGLIFATIANQNILGIHGEVKDMKRAIDEFARVYGVEIDLLLAGHLHHNRCEEVGIKGEVINVPSIIGLDSYSLSLRKSAVPAGKLLVLEIGKGVVADYRLKLEDNF